MKEWLLITFSLQVFKLFMSTLSAYQHRVRTSLLHNWNLYYKHTKQNAGNACCLCGIQYTHPYTWNITDITDILFGVEWTFKISFKNSGMFFNLLQLNRSYQSEVNGLCDTCLPSTLLGIKLLFKPQCL